MAKHPNDSSESTENNVGPRPVGEPAAPAPAPQPPLPEGASYDAGGNLTRAGMERVIATGGTVLHKGALIATREHLPSEADLVGDDERSAENAQRGIDQRQAALDRERETLERRRSEAAAKKKGAESKK
jgi:hypothetical protein